MTSIGVIGTGDMGHALAVRLTGLGRLVHVANSRGPDTLESLARSVGPLALAGTAADVAAGDGTPGRIVFLAIPFGRYDTLESAPFEGALVVDAGNYDIGRDGHHPRLDSGAMTTGQVLAAQLPGATVVKAFNTIWYRRILEESRPDAAHEDRLAVPVASDDPAARRRISALVHEMGFAPVDGGTLAQSARQEYGSLVFNQPVGPARAEELLATDRGAASRDRKEE
ncbi:MAG: NADP oxidoreductase [Propionibacteriales bacterium]|nr:NADP oxidoreductase [Propionibacteriales bacterium]